jgi:phage gpG-like protein
MLLMRIYLEAVGINEAAVRFTKLADARVVTYPAMVRVSQIMMEAIAGQFESGGKRGGGSWRPLSESWAAEKASRGLDPRIGFAKHKLYDSLTIPGADHQRLFINDEVVSLSSDLPYVGTQQFHRPFAKFTKGDRLKMAEAVGEYLIEAWVAAP